MEYRQYLKSRHWQIRRKLALKYAGARCQICSSKKKLEVHHNTYENLSAEEDRDLIVLCGKCHELFHDFLPEKLSTVGLPQMQAIDLWPVIRMDDGTFRKGPRAEIVGRHSRG